MEKFLLVGLKKYKFAQTNGNKMKKNFFCFELFGLVGALFFVACSNSATETTVFHNDDIAVLESGKKLKKQTCDSLNMGELLYVIDSTDMYLCDGKKWVSLKGAAGKQGEKGKDGEKGDTGSKGDDGESLMGDPGIQGPKGEDGVAGTSCKIVSDEDGVVVIKCGEDEDADSTKIYKSICGYTPFDPEKAACFNGELYSCNGKPYNPKNYLCDARDNQMYKVVTIGSFMWMAENLNYNYSVGTAKSYCYDDEPANCEKYGRLYTWAAAMDSAAKFSDDCFGCGTNKSAADKVVASSPIVRGVCPEGWFLPTPSDWFKWTETTGIDERHIGAALKSTEGWKSDGNGTDYLGMAVLPAGYRTSDGKYTTQGEEAYFWSTADCGAGCAIRTLLKSSSTGMEGHSISDGLDKASALSVRCFKAL